MNLRTLRDYRLSMVAGVSQTIKINGNFIGLYEATSPVELIVNGNPAITRQGGDRWKYLESYDEITLSCSVNQTVVIICGFGEMDSGLQGVTVSASVTNSSPNQITSPGHVACPDAATTALVAAHTATQHIYIKSPVINTGTLYLGPASIGASEGVGIDPGEGLKMDCRAAVYARNDTGAAQTLHVSYVRSI